MIREIESPGTVYLVGAGPGDPGLLTVRAAELLRSAEVVAHDSLIPPPILACIGPGAERVAVGRRHGQGPVPWRLHPAVLEHARAGRDVVRLKAGDSHIFGRGGEEVEELYDAGIPFQIVPGISSALAASACAGIPLTHRAYASDVTFASGHDAGGGFSSHTDWHRLGGGTGTLVLFMATRQLRRNLQRLTLAGRDPATPAACVSRAGRPDQRVIAGTVADLAERVERAGAELPALIVIGEVVAAQSAWLERLPFAHLHVVVARAGGSRSRLAARFRSLGARVTESPRYRNDVPLAAEIVGPVDLLVLPSAAAARSLFDAGGSQLARVPIIVMGERTEALARAHGAMDLTCSHRRSIESVLEAARRRLEVAAPAVTPAIRAQEGTR